MAFIKAYNGKAIIRLHNIYICIDMENGDVKAKGTLETCNKALKEV